MNTPIGNGLMASTTLAELTEDVAKHYADGRVTKKMLEKYLADASLAAEILTQNM